jgi:hypothetical protein
MCAAVDEAITGSQITVHEDHLRIIRESAKVNKSSWLGAIRMSAKQYVVIYLEIEWMRDRPLVYLPGNGTRQSGDAPSAICRVVPDEA